DRIVRQPDIRLPSDPVRQSTPSAIRSHSRRNHPMWINDKLACGALVKILITLGRAIQADGSDIDRLGDLDLVVKDALHEGAVVLHDGALAGGELVALGPAQADADAEHADLGVGIDAAG